MQGSFGELPNADARSVRAHAMTCPTHWNPLWREGGPMPNVLDAEPMRAFAGRVGGKIADEQIATRYQRMAFDRLLEDPRNFRPARPEELQTAPDWVGKALARGEQISVFRVNRSAAAR